MRSSIVVAGGLWLACAAGLAQAQGAGAAPASGAPAAQQGAAAAPQGPAAVAAAANSYDPTAVVTATAQGMLQELDKNRAAYRNDPKKLQQLVDTYLLPHFDTEYAARGVLGQYWRTATPDQRQRFIDAFYHSLLTNYGAAIAEFTADRLQIFPSNTAPDARIATVRTEIRRSNGDRVSVNYYLHKTPEGWKAWDVVIDGISYVNSYRTDFGEQIQQQGIDSVIKRLQAGESPNAIAKQAGNSASGSAK
jgi:phospholipid transport system substrate-binding protein